VADLPQHTRELRAFRVLGGPPDLAQPERPQGAAVAPALADLATNLRDLQLLYR
jgi:hypothetical protein